MRLGDSFILRAVASFLFFVINLFAIYLLLRGHNLPGGGFIGGLGSALSFILLILAHGVESAQRILRVDPIRIAGAGVLLALLTSTVPMVLGDAFLTQYNWKLEHVPLLGSFGVGTPLLFDIGVFLVVIGVTTKLMFLLSRSIDGLPALTVPEQSHYAAPLEEPIEEAGRSRLDGEEEGE
jgi:multicomponent Na+:H+ antiporter subunit B